VSYLVDGFVVENPVPVIREMPTTATARNFTGLLPNTRYRFVVTGISSGGQRSTAQQVLITTAGSDCDTSGAASPPSPVNVTAVSNSTSAFTLNWLATTTGPCAKKYLVEVDEGTRR
jgi:chitodextrinase